MKTLLVVLWGFVVAAAILSPCGALAASREDMGFVIIQPGQPGTPEEAKPVLAALGAKLGAMLGLKAPMEGAYCNELGQAAPLIRDRKPVWGIVSLPFYVRYAKQFGMAPLASTRPGGKDKDVWRLMVKKGSVKDWRNLSGVVSGSMLHLPEAAACLLLRTPAAKLPFKLAGTSRPLFALRAAAQGKQAGVVLDAPQFAAVGALPQAASLAELHQSDPLPTSPVVWFGEPDERASSLAAALQSLGEEPEAADLLMLLQTQGFGPPDADLERMAAGAGDGACFH
jgi:hypothetical protein